MYVHTYLQSTMSMYHAKRGLQPKRRKPSVEHSALRPKLRVHESRLQPSALAWRGHAARRGDLPSGGMTTCSWLVNTGISVCVS